MREGADEQPSIVENVAQLRLERTQRRVNAQRLRRRRRQPIGPWRQSAETEPERLPGQQRVRDATREVARAQNGLHDVRKLAWRPRVRDRCAVVGDRGFGGDERRPLMAEEALGDDVELELALLGRAHEEGVCSVRLDCCATHC